jgi:hypothetical protein
MFFYKTTVSYGVRSLSTRLFCLTMPLAFMFLTFVYLCLQYCRVDGWFGYYSPRQLLYVCVLLLATLIVELKFGLLLFYQFNLYLFVHKRTCLGK